MRFFLLSCLLFVALSIPFHRCADLGRPDGYAPEDHPRIALFHSYDVVQDVLPQPPAHLLTLKYPPSGFVADVAQTVPLDRVSSVPSIQWHYNKGEVNDPTVYYALFMLDPDAPSRSDPVNGEWLHWSVYNIPSSNFFSASPPSDVTEGADIAVEYAPPTPPPGSGVHRYVFAVYQQTKKWDKPQSIVQANEWEGRAQWNLLDFLSDMDEHAILRAGTFFMVQN